MYFVRLVPRQSILLLLGDQFWELSPLPISCLYKMYRYICYTYKTFITTSLLSLFWSLAQTSFLNHLTSFNLSNKKKESTPPSFQYPIHNCLSCLAPALFLQNTASQAVYISVYTKNIQYREHATYTTTPALSSS